MSDRIERIAYQLDDLIKKLPAKRQKAIQRRVEKTLAEIRRHNRYNLEMLLVGTDVDLHPIQLPEFGERDGDDESVYVSVDNVQFGRRYRSEKDDRDFETEDEVDEAIEELDTKINELDDKIEELTGSIDSVEEVDQPSPTRAEELKKLQDELGTVEKQKTELEELKESYEAAKDDPQDDELMWNTIWQPFGDRSVSESIAHTCGLGVVTINQGPYEGSYVGLTGCGMDLTPQLMAYVVLAHGVIDHNHVRYFTERRQRDYARGVIGSALMRRCAEKLGVLEAYERAVKQDAKLEAKERRESERRYAKEQKRQNAAPSKAFRALVAEMQAKRDEANRKRDAEALIAGGTGMAGGAPEEPLDLYDIGAEAKKRASDEYSKLRVDQKKNDVIETAAYKRAERLHEECQAFYRSRAALADILART